nr:MAG TPA: hypothetical protein [Caudoviricetes sp.]
MSFENVPRDKGQNIENVPKDKMRDRISPSPKGEI